MLNLTRMEIRRLSKQKSTYFIILAIILFMAVFMLMLHISLQILQNTDNLETSIGEINSGEKVNQGMSLEFTDNAKFIDNIPGEEMVLEQFRGQGILIFFIIFAGIFFTSPYRNGYAKNFLGLSKNRSGYIFAQFITAIIYSVVIFIVATGVLILGQNLALNGRVKITDFAGMLKIIGLQLIPHIAFMAVLLFLATWTRSMSAVLVSGLLYAIIAHEIIWNILTGISKKIIGSNADWSLHNYTVIGSIKNLGWGAGNSEIIRAIIVSLPIMFVALIGSCLVLQKKDV